MYNAEILYIDTSVRCSVDQLFTYLLIHRRRSHPREALATLLWPELPSAHAKKNLRKVLCILQHLLTDAVRPGDPQCC